jgi:hypothetical protein
MIVHQMMMWSVIRLLFGARLFYRMVRLAAQWNLPQNGV